MTEHRFFVPPETLAGGAVALPPDAAHQVAQVLRLRAGEHIVLLDGAGAECEVELEAVGRGRVSGRIVATRAAAGEPRLRIRLCPALLKADKFEWVLQKCTELGVAQFQPLVAERSVRDALSAQKLERWRRIVREAAEQSGRGIVPPVRDPLRFDALRFEGAGTALIAYEGERTLGLHAALAGETARQDLTLVIGPEGGFSADEVERARARGATPVTLGARILRAETASVATVAAAMVLAGEMA